MTFCAGKVYVGARPANLSGGQTHGAADRIAASRFELRTFTFSDLSLLSDADAHAAAMMEESSKVVERSRVVERQAAGFIPKLPVARTLGAAQGSESLRFCIAVN